MVNENLAAPCGIYCGSCEQIWKSCPGCGNVTGKPFWTTQAKVAACPLYDCCVNTKHLEHCGLCEELPCSTFKEFYDPSLSPEEAKESILARQNDLLKRKELGTIKWLESKEGH